MKCEHCHFEENADGNIVCVRCGDPIPPQLLNALRSSGFDVNIIASRNAAIVPIERAKSTALVRGIGRELSPMERHLVEHVRDDQGENPITEEDELALVAAFEEFRGAPSLPRAEDAKQRKKVGEAIARHILASMLGQNARDGEARDRAVKRVVAALGPDDALTVADVLCDWGQALAAYADRAAERGLKR